MMVCEIKGEAGWKAGWCVSEIKGEIKFKAMIRVVNV
jgi:hypothetical protein